MMNTLKNIVTINDSTFAKLNRKLSYAYVGINSDGYYVGYYLPWYHSGEGNIDPQDCGLSAFDAFISALRIDAEIKEEAQYH